jgi:predicted neuraminidase
MPSVRLSPFTRERLQAAAKGRTALSDSILDRDGSLIDSPDDPGQTAPFHAARNNRFGAVKLLVERGAHVHRSDAVLTHLDGRIQALSRSQQLRVVECWYADGGKTWSKLVATSLPNPDSGIDAVTLADGRHLLVDNPTTKGRSQPTVAISLDGKTRKTALVLEDQSGEYSYPAVIQSADGLVHITSTWHRKKIPQGVVGPKERVLREVP